MKIVREYINEKFTEEGDPIKDMGIGKKVQILQDLKKIGLGESDVYFNNDYTFFMKRKGDAPTTFLDVQLKHFPFEKKALLRELERTGKDVYGIINQAIQDKIKLKEIKEIVDYVFSYIPSGHPRYNDYKGDKNKANIYLTKLARPKKQVKEEKDENIYVFIGYDEKVPVKINGKTYYEDKFMAEKLVKIDKYNTADLAQVSGMKMRAEYARAGHVYMVTVPKYLMDEDYYNDIPEENRYIIEKYKKRI